MINRFTRFNNIYDSKREAILKLDNTSRHYAETVAIRYYNNGSTCVILALFNSEKVGDYIISFDSGSESLDSKVFKTEKSVENQSDEDCINAFFSDKIPRDKDIIIIKTNNLEQNSYIYYDKTWISLYSHADFSLEESESIEVSKKENTLNTFKAEVKTDNLSIVVGDNGIEVGIIDGGEL